MTLGRAQSRFPPAPVGIAETLGSASGHRTGTFKATGGVAAVLAVLTLAAAPAADASGVRVQGTNLQYTELEGEGDADLTVTALAGGQYEVRDPGTTIIPLGGCADTAEDGHRIICDGPTVATVDVFVEDGDDRVKIVTRADARVCGGEGDDTLASDAGSDLLIGGPGTDSLSGGSDVDDLIAENPANCADDPWGGTSSPNSLDGGDGADFIYGGPGGDRMNGGGGDDFLFGFAGADRIQGGDGADQVIGMDGADDLSGSGGADFVSGGPDDDREQGDAGNDDLAGLVLIEIGGRDFANTDNGADAVDGGPGDDAIAGGPVVPSGTRVFGDQTTPIPTVAATAARNGPDTLRGGPGHDHVTYELRLGELDVTLDGVANDGASGEGDLVASDVEQLTGGPGPNRLVGGAGDETIDGARGADTVLGGGGGDTLSGGALDEAPDALDGGPGTDMVDGGPGDDVAAGGAGADRVLGGGGNDDLEGGPDDDALDGGAGSDTLRDGPGADTLSGGPDIDWVDFSAGGVPVTVDLNEARDDGADGRDLVEKAENVRGGGASDTLRGDGGPNVLEGGAGDDVLDGRAGDDIVRAGPGRDAVRSRDGRPDTIACGSDLDFAAVDGADRLDRAPAERCERADDGRTRVPRAGRFALLDPRGCTLAVRFAGTTWTVPVQDRVRLPVRSEVRTTRCAARLRAAGAVRPGRRGRRAFLIADLADGGIRLSQRRSRRPRTALRLVGAGFGRCTAAAQSVRLSIRSARLIVRRGPLSVRGRFSDVTARTATLVVNDRCDGTLTEVLKGRARVRDRGRARSFTLRRGGRHLARRRPRT
jgi:Ca2+-binding RTX toxin-like protein